MHSFNKDGTAPLHLDVEPILSNNTLNFYISESHIKLEKYYLDYISVSIANEFCSNEDLGQAHKSKLPFNESIMWEYKPKLPKEKIEVLSAVGYGVKGKSKKLQKNILYIIELGIKKVDNNQYPRKGHTLLSFYIDEKENIIFPRTYEEKEVICEKFNLIEGH